MRYTRWFFHPIAVFVFSIVALGLSLFLYIYWYVGVSSTLEKVIANFDLDPNKFFELQTWVVIVVLSILVGLILVGIFIIFVYNVKNYRLYRLQNNFINNFTHELKTPVTSMQLYLQTFKIYDLPRDRQLKYIDYMLADVARLNANISHILNLARIESKTYQGEFADHDLVRLVTRFTEKNRQLFRNCEIRIHNPSGRPFSHPVDLPFFEMLLMNLYTNALKYNTSEAPGLDITFIPRKDNLHITFTDNGIGIAQRELKRIFRKFYQVDRNRGGSGLGLYLVDHIAKIHKGRITAESEGPGRGTTFVLVLPLIR